MKLKDLAKHTLLWPKLYDSGYLYLPRPLFSLEGACGWGLGGLHDGDGEGVPQEDQQLEDTLIPEWDHGYGHGDGDECGDGGRAFYDHD
jgi:hypothetical protein